MTNFWWRFAAFWLLAGLALRVFIAGQLGSEDLDARAATRAAFVELLLQQVCESLLEGHLERLDVRVA